MKASIVIIAYNHQRWLADAIDSALAQKTNFKYEIVIGVDVSDDRTLDGALQYAKFYDNIRVAYSSKRIGGKHNLSRSLALAKGEYIALMDGDDFWNCKHKLQDQVSFLEKNKGYSASVTQAEIEYHGYFDKRFESNYCRTQKDWHGDDVITTPSFAANSSIVFKKDDVFPMPQWFFDMAWGDSALRGMLASRGKFHYLQRKATTYRCNTWGALHKLREKGEAYMKKSSRQILENVAEYRQKLLTT